MSDRRSALAWRQRIPAFLRRVTVGASALMALAGSALAEPEGSAMSFAWIACETACTGWVQASGVITETTAEDFARFAQTRDLRGATIVIRSGGGSVNGAISLGRAWRQLGVRTTVGQTVRASSGRDQPQVSPQANCESMCAFLLLAGTERYVPPEAEVRVHQIWFGDVAHAPKSAAYSADDMSIVQRDIGRLASYASDMGASGALFEIMLSVPPWERLHRLSVEELELARVATTQASGAVLPAHVWQGPNLPMKSAKVEAAAD